MYEMMPYRVEDPMGTIPDRKVASIVARITANLHVEGVGYLTYNRDFVPAGKAHRRAGLHTDGSPGQPSLWFGCRPACSIWWRAQLLWSDAPGLRFWERPLTPEELATVGEDGDCAHLAHLYPEHEGIEASPFRTYTLRQGQVHESFALPEDRTRTFIRITPPSDVPWPDYYTHNPLGIYPKDVIHYG